MAADTLTARAARGADGAVERGATVTGWVSASPEAVFALVTDLDRLPEWNVVVRKVLERPARLAPAAEWVVRIRPRGMPSWPSRSTCVELDPERGVFAYRSRSDDGNPSWADWRWEVHGEDGGSRVVVSYVLNPRTRARIVLFSQIRQRQLSRSEIRGSLVALGRVLGAATRSA